MITNMRLLLLTMPVVLIACSGASPPPPPAFGSTPPAAPREIAPSAGFPANFTIVFTREYGYWLYRTCAVEVSLFLSTDSLSLECVTTTDKHEKFSRVLAPGETARVRELARAADLYGSNHIGKDSTPTDGTFETLRFRPVAGGRAVVLVTSGNRSFEDEPARRDLLQWLQSILREHVEGRGR
jgi:hypothetical protein